MIGSKLIHLKILNKKTLILLEEFCFRRVLSIYVKLNMSLSLFQIPAQAFTLGVLYVIALLFCYYRQAQTTCTFTKETVAFTTYIVRKSNHEEKHEDKVTLTKVSTKCSLLRIPSKCKYNFISHVWKPMAA